MSIRDDIKALGVGAPLRAGYELSKRTVGHQLVFGHLVPTRRHPTHVRLLPAPANLSDSVRARSISVARSIAGGTVEVFSTDIAISGAPDWHAALHTPGSWAVLPWWKIDIRSDARLGDIKWCWELARFRHVVLLARGCFLLPNDAELATALRLHVESFLDQNPPEQGVHWYSNLELALRSFAWLQVLSLAGDTLGDDLEQRVIATLHHTGRHLVADLPYTVSTMRNNHLLGDAVGLCALGHAFSDDRFGRRWTRIGDRLIDRFLRTAGRDHGTFIEDSVSYHRFVVELLSARVVLGGSTAHVRSVLRESAEFLVRLGCLDGDVPQYGDWDEGRALVTAADPRELAGSVLAALALTGQTRADAFEFDEVAWYCSPGPAVGDAVPNESNQPTRGDIGGGVARVARGSYQLWLKAPAGTSHNHADATAVSLQRHGRWVTGDPGTGTYNGPVVERNWFRSSQSHNVLRPEGLDQLEPHRAFRWKFRANGGLLEPVDTADGVVLASWHDAYHRLDQPITVVRAVLLHDHGVVVADFTSRPTVGALSIPLHPGATYAAGVVAIDDQRYHLTLPGDPSAHTGEEAPFTGWWSDTYGRRTPTTVVDVATPVSSPVVWALGDEAMEWHAEPNVVTIGSTSIVVEWSANDAVLRVTGGDSHNESRRISW